MIFYKNSLNELPWVGLQCVIVVFPDYTHLLFDESKNIASMRCGLLWLRKL